jgi:RHS repeat-associated protein
MDRDNSGLINHITGDKEMNVIYNPDLEITGVQHITPTPFQENYTYDTRGNRLTSLDHSYAYNELNRFQETFADSFQFDADGNLVLEKDKTAGEIKKYYYNSENRMIGFEHYPNETSPADIAASYTYDIYGRRLKKNFNGVVTNFLWEGNNLAYEMDASYQPIRRYIYGAEMDDVEGHVEFSEVTGGVFDDSRNGWYTYVKDQVGTVYKVYSDYQKQIVDTHTYDTFGNLVSQDGSSKGNLGLQGKYFDRESGLYYFYNRYYNPIQGRFQNEDPIGLEGGINMYRFANSNPINFYDPMGLDAKVEILKWGWIIAAAEPTPVLEAVMIITTATVGVYGIIDWIFFSKTKTKDHNWASQEVLSRAKQNEKDPCDIINDWIKKAKCEGRDDLLGDFIKAAKILGCRNKQKRKNK